MAENKGRRLDLEQALGFRVAGSDRGPQIQFINETGVVTRVRPASMEEERMWNALVLGQSLWGALGSPLDA